ncbi:MAG: hypothetical protein Tsb002_18950 [Wenzhouxiangellaceae bacterium]
MFHHRLFNRYTVLISALMLSLSMLALAQSNSYDSGQEALRQAQWNRAISAFQQVIDEAGEQSDAALYWQAYAYTRLGRASEAQQTIQRLRRDYPQSPWRDDADALRVSIDASRDQVEIGQLDDELKVYALAGLMEKHAERALPLAEDLLRNSDDPEVREQALFVIGSSQQPRAREIIRAYALNSSDRELQRNAIYLMSDEGGEASMVELERIYAASDDVELKQTILYALGNNDQIGRVMELLNNEPTTELQVTAIHALANMQAIEQLHSLSFDALNSEARRALIYAYAETSSLDPENIPRLVKIYRETSDQELKETILYALGNNEQENIVAELLAAEPDPELQAVAIYALNNMEAHDRLRQLDIQQLQGDARAALIHVYADMGEVEALASILNHVSDQDLRHTIIYSLGQQSDAKGRQTILDYYQSSQADTDDRRAVAHALIADDAIEEVIALLRSENDRELKAEMIAALAASDHPAAQEFVFRMLEQ